MPHVILKRVINAPVAKVWESWDDYAHIEKFNPNLSASYLVNQSQPTGLGAERQCDLSDGRNFIQERIIDYVPNRRMKIEIFNGTLPVRDTFATIEMQETGPDRTEVTFRMEFVPKFGLIGRMMVPMMKPQFRKLLGRLLDANKAYVEDGVEIMRAA
ncbi:SRPBCC family protein [Shimia biformata]|uniref:SRPBCC family protein n=1 Tax=Shimia biformata TaxID=1294299 RepID=UPI00194FF898|nr:SRPBCC family protein [Shimia biformata]